MELRISLGISGPPPEVIPNIPVGSNRNGPFHFNSERNFRNLWHNESIHYHYYSYCQVWPCVPSRDLRETGNERETQDGCGRHKCIKVVKILFLRQTIDEETAFGVFSLSKRIFRCEFVCQC